MRKLAFCALLPFLAVAQPSIAGNAAAEFSATSNPTGAWSYGWQNTLGGAFSLFTNKLSFSGVDSWFGNQPPIGIFPGYPIIWRSSTLPTDILTAHPGRSGEQVALRWTAPITGLASISASFVQNAQNPATADVHVLFNGGSLYSGTVNGSVATAPYSGSRLMAAGDTIDFTVGYGSNANFDFDTIDMTVSMSITPVPESSTQVLLATGLLLLAYKLSSRRAQFAQHTIAA